MDRIAERVAEVLGMEPMADLNFIYRREKLRI